MWMRSLITAAPPNEPSIVYLLLSCQSTPAAARFSTTAGFSRRKPPTRPRFRSTAGVLKASTEILPAGPVVPVCVQAP
jgi:hypothetical protein